MERQGHGQFSQSAQPAPQSAVKPVNPPVPPASQSAVKPSHSAGFPPPAEISGIFAQEQNTSVFSVPSNEAVRVPHGSSTPSYPPQGGMQFVPPQTYSGFPNGGVEFAPPHGTVNNIVYNVSSTNVYNYGAPAGNPQYPQVAYPQYPQLPSHQPQAGAINIPPALK
jgi:hypothetical protein